MKKKLYCIVVSDVYDYCENYHKPELATTARERDEIVARLKAQALKDTPDWKLENHKGDTGFSLYLDGEYSCNHYTVTAYEYDMDIMFK